MLNEIRNQFGTLVTVMLVIFFCISGMTSCEYIKPPVSALMSPRAFKFHNTIAKDGYSNWACARSRSPVSPEKTLPIQLTTAPSGYFEDALFIGDSRTVGLYEYGRIPGAAYFAASGMSVYSIFYDEVGNISFQDLMESRTFGKIYLMLGINELGYDFDRTVTEYEELIEWIRLHQPDAIIYIEANLHVSANRSNSDRIYNNANLDAFNERISELADGVHIFYLDVNPLFDDDNGNLADEFTVDDTHVLGKYYRTWSNWITENAAVIPT